MYETYLNNRITNALVYCLFLLLLLLISPFLFLWELLHSVVSCFRVIISEEENMSGKVVLITGASSGLGELMTYEYAKRGAYLAIVAIKEPESQLERVADRARELGSPDVLFVFADVSKVDECRMFVDDTVKHFGRLDHLVCNAGIGPIYSIDTDVTNYESVMASKAALISFYESLRYEVSPKVTITILTLGFVQTNIITAKCLTSNVTGLRLTKDIVVVLPAMGAEPCAKAIVDGVCKGATSITEPKFFKALCLIKFIFPQLHRFYFNFYFLAVFKRLQS